MPNRGGHQPDRPGQGQLASGGASIEMLIPSRIHGSPLTRRWWGNRDEIADTVQAEILTEPQILLTAFVVVLKPQPWDQPTSRHSAPVPVKGRRSMLGKRAERERCAREIAQ